jgi:hypothetical protein
MKKTILSWLLHHANRYTKSQNFYDIKTKLLKKHGTLIGYDYQFIDGKECWSCDGTGVYKGYSYSTGPFKEWCYKCGGTGWYIKDHWNSLAIYNFGKYSFHLPMGRQFVKPAPGAKIIDGYISHDSSYWSRFARIVIFLLYDFGGYKKRWWFGFGGGRRKWSFRPATIINNIAYIRYHWRDYLPKKKVVYEIYDNELPF